MSLYMSKLLPHIHSTCAVFTFLRYYLKFFPHFISFKKNYTIPQYATDICIDFFLLCFIILAFLTFKQPNQVNMDETNNIFVAFYEVFEGNVVVVVLCSFSSQIKRVYAFWKALIDSCVKWPKKWSSEQSIIVTCLLEKLCGNAFDVIGHDISLNVLMINKRRKGEKRFAKGKNPPFSFFSS